MTRYCCDGLCQQGRSCPIGQPTSDGWIVLGIIVLFTALIALLILGAYIAINWPRLWI